MQNRVGKPKRPETQTDTSDAYTRVQRAENNLRKPTEKPECIRIPRNGCIKPNSGLRGDPVEELLECMAHLSDQVGRKPNGVMYTGWYQ